MGGGWWARGAPGCGRRSPAGRVPMAVSSLQAGMWLRGTQPVRPPGFPSRFREGTFLPQGNLVPICAIRGAGDG